MNIFVLCATRRGELFLKKLFHLLPEANYFVFSFPETPHEPRYYDNIFQLSKMHHAHFYEATNFANPGLSALWEKTQIDLCFVVSWRYMIPMDLAGKVKVAPIVFHDSLLPEYRGFSPTVWAIINGESTTGVSVFYLEEQVDSGELIDQAAVPIGDNETIADVMEKVTGQYLDLLEKNLPLILNRTAPRRIQNHAQATYVPKRLPEDNQIDWKRSSRDILNPIRAVTYPYPGAFTWFRGKKLIIWSASIPEEKKKYVGIIPGAVTEIKHDKGVTVLTGDGEICIHEVQLENEQKINAADLIRSFSVRLGI